jgi:predicted nucleic acid-binding Zn ribbon protein
MFRKEVKPISELLSQYLRRQGMETPLLQRRVVDTWDTLMGPAIAQYTSEKFIKNQVLYVKILNPALRQDLNMMRSQLVKRLNDAVGSQIITEVRIY